MWNIERYQDGIWHCYRLTRDGKLAGLAKWRSVCGHAQLHNEVITPTHETVRQAREVFKMIQQDAKEAGCMTLSCTARYDAKMIRYWRLIGFEVFGATMEV